MGTIKYYILVKRLNKGLESHNPPVSAINKMLDMEIEVKEEFYYAFQKSGTVILNPYISGDFDFLLSEFSNYFDYGVDLSVLYEEEKEKKRLLICQLEDMACFNCEEPSDYPF